jgi:peroxiredoxin
MPKRSSKVPDGTAAPGFSLPSSGGKALSLDDYRGKSWVFLVFMRSRL